MMEGTGIDWIGLISTGGVGLITAIGGYFTGRRKKKNDFLQDLQQSIDLLSAKNAELLKANLELHETVVGLKTQIAVQGAQIEAQSKLIKEQEDTISGLRSEVSRQAEEINQLNERLSGVKTITRQK